MDKKNNLNDISLDHILNLNVMGYEKEGWSSVILISNGRVVQDPDHPQKLVVGCVTSDNFCFLEPDPHRTEVMVSRNHATLFCDVGSYIVRKKESLPKEYLPVYDLLD